MREQLDIETHPSFPSVSISHQFFPPQICAQQILAIILFHKSLIRNFHTLTKPPRFVAIRLFVRHVGETWRMEGRRCYLREEQRIGQLPVGVWFAPTGRFFWAIFFATKLPATDPGSPILKSYKICINWTLGRQGPNCSTAARIV